MNNRNDWEQRLADYAADNLDEEARRAFEAELAGDPALQHEAHALREVARHLGTLSAPPLQEAIGLTAPLRVVRCRPWPVRWLYAGLRAAALIGLGIGVGWFMGRDQTEVPTQQAVAPPAEQTQVVDFGAPYIHPGWVALAAEAGGTQSGMARALMALAPR